MAKARRCQKQKSKGYETCCLEKEFNGSPSQEDSKIVGSDVCLPSIPGARVALEAIISPFQAGQTLSSGEAHFPVMTPSELAAIAVPASAPPDEVRLCLAEHGVSLVTDILSQQECFDLERLWQADLLGALDTTRVDESSLAAAKRLRSEGIAAWQDSWSVGLGKKGVVSQRGLPHGAFAWNARMHPEVRKVFSNIFSTATEELAVGLDCTFWSSADSLAAVANNEWLHCDQNHRTGLTWPCVQGVLYVWPSEGEKASTTVVWPGSHKDVYRRIMEDAVAYKRGKTGGQSVRLSQLTDRRLREDLTARAMASSRRVPCPAGSLLLWDSRTIHQGWAGGPRLAQPICWEPRQRREQDGAALMRKMLMCALGLPSSHSSAEARVHGMAPRSRHCELLPSAETIGMRAQILPYGIADEDRGQWEAAQSLLWAAQRNPSEANVDVWTTLCTVLNAEVLKVL